VNKVLENVYARRSLEAMTKLEKDWDTYGAAPINKRCIEKAYRMLNVMPGTWMATPTVDGGVMLEQHEDGFDMQLEISSAETREEAL
jgi:hypothetical protein